MSRHVQKRARLFAVAVVIGGVLAVGGVAATALGFISVSNQSSQGPTSTDEKSLALNGDLVPLVSSAGLPTPERVSAADRFDGSVAISRRAFPGTAPVVYVASGEGFLDALSAGPAAAHEGGPLLLTTIGALPASVRAEIIRLSPHKIVAVGGVNAVSDATFNALQGLAPSVVRVGGADRFETSRNVDTYAFGSSGTSTAYLVTGLDFPDAISAGSAAAQKDSPIILVNGPTAAIDAPTAALLQTLGVNQALVVGGPVVVSASLESSADAVVPTYRVAGDDRFVGSQVVNREAFTDNTDSVILASGANYPDALAGAPLAAALDSPLYLVPTDCVPNGVLTDIRTRAAAHIILLGGTSALSASVQSLTSCGW